MATVRLPFPTGKTRRGGGAVLGEPDRAKACAGHRALVDGETCVWCGRLTADIIDRTWSDRAAAIDRAGRAPVPFTRFAYRASTGEAPWPA